MTKHKYPQEEGGEHASSSMFGVGVAGLDHENGADNKPELTGASGAAV